MKDDRHAADDHRGLAAIEEGPRDFPRPSHDRAATVQDEERLVAESGRDRGG